MADPLRLRQVPHRPPAFIISDISNEPDDAQSLVRLLLYGNDLDIRGLVACTSTWLRSTVHPEDMHAIVRAYAKVVDNLNAHTNPETNPFPPAEYYAGLIKSGPACYGQQALAGDFPMSEGALALIDAVDACSDDSEPLWILCWGGVNTLAQALQHIQSTRSAEQAKLFRSRLRVYTISDQDDCGAWIRLNFPDVVYICSIHGWNSYGSATWIGISGDVMIPHLDAGGPDTSLVSKEWLAANIQKTGSPLGAVYPDTSFIMEGDTPTFLYLIPNGLSVPEQPSWGSWGGRYGLIDLNPLGDGKGAKHWGDIKDTVTGKDGRTHWSGQASIWRWRKAYQADFAARMRWTLSPDRRKANHAPVVVVNDSTAGPEAYYIDAEAGSEITLDASASYDPDNDGDNVSPEFSWMHYKEPTQTDSLVHWVTVPDVTFVPTDSKSVFKVTIPPPEACAVAILTGEPLEKGQVLHFILSVRDNGNGTPHRLTTYKRVVVQVTNHQKRGGRNLGGKVFESVTSATGHSNGRDTLSATQDK